jgi:hypothetical protein
MTANLSIIEEYRPGTITTWPSAEMTQETLNDLHVYFERLRGDYADPPRFFVEAPESVRRAVVDLNYLIHRWESHVHNERLSKPNSRLHCEFTDRPRHNLADEDYQHFTMTRQFGVLYINYCEVGKPLYDVFKDADLVVGDHNIKPLRYYSADFMISFHDGISAEKAADFRRRFDLWFDRNANYLNALGFVKDDPKLALGLIPVATLQMSEPADAIVANISQRQAIRSIQIIGKND